MAKIHKSKLNILTTLMKQLIAALCGILLPRVLIAEFGSTVYGATTSIAQFLSYIALLEGGIGRVARGALYEPLASGNKEQVSRLYQTIRRFFLKIAGIFMVYTLVVAFFYYDIADVTAFDRKFAFALIIAISLSTMTNYLGGIADLTLMNADQKQYLTNAIMSVTSVLNVLLVVLLAKVGSNILIIKLATALVFVLRRIFYTVYVKKHYQLPKVPTNGCKLEQKWTGMGQHIAFFLHTNTDIILLTLFVDLKIVAVYSVYYLVVRTIWDISSSFSGGMESIFGELIAKKKSEALNLMYGKYSMMLTMVALVLFGCAGVLIIPFVRLYMAGITDANYIQPIFALLLLLAEAINCMVLPYTTLPIAANQLKQTRWGSYGEAILNIILSLLLIQWNPLIGVAIGTLTATVFKAIFYIIYTTKHILRCNIWYVLRRILGAVALLLIVSCGGMVLLWNVFLPNFFIWAAWAVVVFLLMGIIALIFGKTVYSKELTQIFRNLLPKKVV